MRLANTDADRAEFAAGAAEIALARMVRKAVEDVFGQKFGRGVLAFELRHVIEVLVVQRLEHFFQRFKCAADVDHDAVAVERIGDERGIDHEGRAVQRLRRAEHRAAKRVGDHDVIADFDDEQGCLSRIADELAEYAAPGLQDIRKTIRKFAESHRGRKQRVESRVRGKLDR